MPDAPAPPIAAIERVFRGEYGRAVVPVRACGDIDLAEEARRVPELAFRLRSRETG